MCVAAKHIVIQVFRPNRRILRRHWYARCVGTCRPMRQQLHRDESNKDFQPLGAASGVAFRRGRENRNENDIS